MVQLCVHHQPTMKHIGDHITEVESKTTTQQYGGDRTLLYKGSHVITLNSICSFCRTSKNREIQNEGECTLL